MTTQREHMLGGTPYRPEDPDLVASRIACQRLVDAFNATRVDERVRRRRLLSELLGSLGEGAVILPRLTCDYGSHIHLGAHSFVNYDVVLLDCAPISIGDHAQVGPVSSCSPRRTPSTTTTPAGRVGSRRRRS